MCLIQQFIRALDQPKFQFARCPPGKGRYQNSVAGGSNDEEFVQNTPHEHLGLARSRSSQNLENAIGGSDRDDLPLRSIGGQWLPANLRQDQVKKFKESIAWKTRLDGHDQLRSDLGTRTSRLSE